MDRGHLIEQRKDRHPIHYRGFEQKAPSARDSQIAQLPISVNDWPFVGRDGVGSVLQRCANVIDARLTAFDIERGRFEEDVSAGSLQPCLDTGCVFPAPSTRQGRLRILTLEFLTIDGEIKPGRIGDPPKASSCNPGEAK